MTSPTNPDAEASQRKPRSRLARALGLWAPVGGVMAALAYGSLRLAPPAAALFPHADKLLHLAAYALLAFLLGRAVRRSTRVEPRDVAIAALVWASAWGSALEVAQAFVEREPNLLDALANIVGAALGALAWLLC